MGFIGHISHQSDSKKKLRLQQVNSLDLHWINTSQPKLGSLILSQLSKYHTYHMTYTLFHAEILVIHMTMHMNFDTDLCSQSSLGKIILVGVM